jgi:small conductance mechanosensitive channel
LEPFQFYIEAVFVIIAVLLVCYAITRGVKIFVDHWFMTRHPESKVPASVIRIVGFTTFFVGLTVLLGMANINIWPIVAGFLIGGIAVGLALQGTLSNLFAGMHLASTSIVHVGDNIEIDGTNIAGIVLTVGWASTRIKAADNTIAIVPNSKLTAAIILNHGSGISDDLEGLKE